jgi:hypothetical protein
MKKIFFAFGVCTTLFFFGGTKDSLLAELKSAKANEDLQAMQSAYFLLAEFSRTKNDFKSADLYSRKAQQIKDTLLAAENRKEKLTALIRNEFEKKAAADSVRYAEMQKVKERRLEMQKFELRRENSQRKTLTWGVIAIIASFILAGIAGIIILIVKLTRKK